MSTQDNINPYDVVQMRKSTNVSRNGNAAGYDPRKSSIIKFSFYDNERNGFKKNSDTQKSSSTKK